MVELIVCAAASEAFDREEGVVDGVEEFEVGAWGAVGGLGRGRGVPRLFCVRRYHYDCLCVDVPCAVS